MSMPTIEEMREVQEFIPWDKWPNNIRTNCIAYALGLPIDSPYFVSILKGSALNKLETLLKDLGFEYRRINSEKELENSEYGIVLYDYLYKETKRAFGCEWTDDEQEIHLARIEPDGSWSHKQGFDLDACLTSKQEIHDIILRDDKVDVNPTAYFAVRKPR